MLLKLRELAKFNTAQNIFTGKLPLNLAYKITKIQKAIAEDLEFYQKQYLEIIEDFGQRDEKGQLKYSEDGTVILIEPEKINEAQKKLTELDNKEVELDIESYLLELSDFDDTKKISVDELDGILPFIK